MTLATIARARRSVRGFLPDPVPRTLVEGLLATARCAPSGANLQPGRFIALTGTPLANLITALETAIDANRPMVSEYRWFPTPMPLEMKDRQRAAGYALYASLGIDKRDFEGRAAQFRRNYRFFDAPVGLVITLDRRFGEGGFFDLGMAVQTLQLAATDVGLATCGLGALANYADVVHAQLGLPENDMVICGMALGKEDQGHPANRTRTDRMALADYADLRGFDD